MILSKIIPVFIALTSAQLAMAQTQTVTNPVKFLSSATFKSTKTAYNVLDIAFHSGGCSPSNNKISYRLSLDSKEVKVTEPEMKQLGAIGNTVTASISINVLETVPAGPVCAMAFDMKDSVDVNQLLISQAKDLGLDLDAVDTAFEIEFHVAASINGSTTVANFTN